MRYKKLGVLEKSSIEQESEYLGLRGVTASWLKEKLFTFWMVELSK